MSVNENRFCPVCFYGVDLDPCEHELCDKHVKEIVEMAVRIIQDASRSKEPVSLPEITCKEVFGHDITRDVEGKVLYATVKEYLEDFGHVSVECLESLDFWRFMSRMFHVHQELKLRFRKEDDILDLHEILMQDEPIVCEGYGRRKIVIPDEVPTKEEMKAEKEQRRQMRATRQAELEAELQPQADIDAINDAVDEDHRAAQEATKEELADERAKADEEIAKKMKALAEKSDDEVESSDEEMEPCDEMEDEMEDEPIVCEERGKRKRFIPDSEDEALEPCDEMQDESIVYEGRGKRKLVIPDSDDDEAVEPRDEVVEPRDEVVEPRNEMEEFLDRCFQRSSEELDTSVFVEYSLSVDTRSRILQWIQVAKRRMSNNVPVEKVENYLRNVFSVPDDMDKRIALVDKEKSGGYKWVFRTQ